MDFAAEVKSQVDIVSVVGEYVRLKRVGTTQSHTGLCPFHTEKTPSFRVHSNHQFFKCFGCGIGGDVFKFVQEIERLSFWEALKLLAEKHGIPLPKRSEYADAETRLRAALYQMHELAAQAFRASLLGPAGADARGYLARRGLAPEQVEQFGLGYAERSGQVVARLFEREGFGGEAMDQSGLVLRRQDGSGFFDRFRNRLIFPIHNESGKVIAFAGRALDPGDEPKYLNSPETPIYKKTFVLYNLHRAKEGIRKDDRSVLVEGYMDVIGVSAAGVSGVVASCGTALTAEQIRSMKRHSDRIVVNFDPDAAGANAAERSIQLLLTEGIQVRILQLPGRLDPDEFCRQRGGDEYHRLLDGAQGYFHWLADRIRTRYDMKTAEGRYAGFQFLLPSIQRLTDPIERAAVAGDVASYLGIDAGLVRDQFRKAAVERRDQPQSVEPVSPVERILLNLLLASPQARQRLLPVIREQGLAAELASRRVFEAIGALEDSGASFGFAELDARLEEPDRLLLASTVMGSDTDADQLTLEVGDACLAKLELQARRGRMKALEARVREAERSGDLTEAVRLTEEWQRLRSSLPADAVTMATRSLSGS